MFASDIVKICPIINFGIKHFYWNLSPNVCKVLTGNLVLFYLLLLAEDLSRNGKVIL